MAGVIVDTNLKNHDDAIRLGEILGDRRAWTMLVDLWSWALDANKESGIINVPAWKLAGICDWQGEPMKLLEAMIECGWLQPIAGGYRLRGWGRTARFFKERNRLKGLRDGKKKDESDEDAEDTQNARVQDAECTRSARVQNGALVLALDLQEERKEEQAPAHVEPKTGSTPLVLESEPRPSAKRKKREVTPDMQAVMAYFRQVHPEYTCDFPKGTVDLIRQRLREFSVEALQKAIDAHAVDEGYLKFGAMTPKSVFVEAERVQKFLSAFKPKQPAYTHYVSPLGLEP